MCPSWRELLHDQQRKGSGYHLRKVEPMTMQRHKERWIFYSLCYSILAYYQQTADRTKILSPSIRCCWYFWYRHRSSQLICPSSCSFSYFKTCLTCLQEAKYNLLCGYVWGLLWLFLYIPPSTSRSVTSLQWSTGMLLSKRSVRETRICEGTIRTKPQHALLVGFDRIVPFKG
jgi:hypothetical protein